MHARSIAAASAVAVLAVSLVTSPVRAAVPVAATCGATLTTDAYLPADLVCTQSLTVTGDITLDLRGHRLSGPSTDVSSLSAPGILILGGTAITIRNGRLDHWGDAVRVGPYPSDPDAETLADVTVSVHKVTFARNTVGLAAGDFIDRQVSSNFTVDRSRFEANSGGISSDNAGRVAVARSVFVGQKNSGIYAYGRSTTTLTDSRISGGKTGLSCYSTCTVTRSRIEKSTTAVAVLDATATVADSQLSGSRVGLQATYLATARLTRTAVKANKTGVLVGQLSSVTADHSQITGNEVGVTAQRQFDPTNSLAYRLSLTANVVSRNEDGIYLRPDSESSVELQDNLVARNTRYGIFVPGATDLGGNRSVDNGRPCVGVVCGP